MNDPLPFPGSFAKISFRVETMLGNAGVNSIRTAVFTAPGDVAQLGERSVRNAEVVGSTPIISTLSLLFLLGPSHSRLTPTSCQLTPKTT